MTNSQKELYKLLGLDSSLVTHHEDGTISYDGHVNWYNRTFKVFPLKFRRVTGDFSCIGCTSLVSLEGAPKEVRDFYCINCTSLRSLKGGPQKVKDLALEGTPIYVVPEDMEITDVWLGGPNRFFPVAEAREILQDFKSGITTDEGAAEVLLDRMNRPLWQVAYATDYLNKDIQK